MKMLNFARRNFKEIIRDPLSLLFSLLLPLFLLFIFQQFEIPGEVYRIENFTPGIVVFSFAFITMFTASLVARDRSTALLVRLGVSPMRGSDYVLGYLLAVLPLAAVQNLLFLSAAVLMGLKPSLGVLYAALASLPIAVLFVALGILLGSVTGEKSSAGVSGVAVQLVAFTSGMYFDGSMVGDFFGKVCDCLPFAGAVEILRVLLNGTGKPLARPLLTVAVYLTAATAAAVLLFKCNMHKAAA